MADSLGDAKLVYNILRKQLGVDAEIGAMNNGEEFVLVSIVGVQDIPRLLKLGKRMKDYSEEGDGVYI